MNNQPETDEKAFFQKHFDTFDSPPDEKVWTAIQQKMDPPTQMTILWKNPRFLSLAVAALLLTGYLTWQWAEHTTAFAENQAEAYTSDSTRGSKNRVSVPDTYPVPTDSGLSSAHGRSFSAAIVSPTSAATTEMPAQPGSEPTTSTTSQQLPSGQEGVGSLSQPVSRPAYTERAERKKHVLMGNKEPDTYSTNEIDTPVTTETAFVQAYTYAPSTTLRSREANTLSANDTSTRLIQEGSMEKTQSERTPIPVYGEVRNPLYRKEYARLQIRGIQSAYVLPAARTLTFPTVQAVKRLPEIEPVSRKKQGSGSWHVLGSATHFMNYYAISPMHSDAVFVKSLESMPALSSQRSSWQLQAGVQYAFAPRWSIRGAVFYAYQKQVINYRLQNATDITHIGNPSPDEVVITRSEASYSKEQFSRLQKQIGLQLALLYELPANPSFSHYLVSGMQGGWTQKNEYTSSVQTDVHVGYGIRRPFTPQLSFWLEPSFRYALQSVQNPVIRIRPYYFGISAGLSFQVSR